LVHDITVADDYSAADDALPDRDLPDVGSAGGFRRNDAGQLRSLGVGDARAAIDPRRALARGSGPR
jgi:hypothetical protein